MQDESAIPIDGPHVEFAQTVRELMGWYQSDANRKFTTRMVQRKTGVSASTVSSMTRGDSVGQDTIRKFVAGMGGDLNRLLILAGHVPLELISTVAEMVAPARPNLKMTDGGRTLPEIQRELIVDNAIGLAAVNNQIGAEDIGQAIREQQEERAKGYQGHVPGKRKKSDLDIELERQATENKD